MKYLLISLLAIITTFVGAQKCESIVVLNGVMSEFNEHSRYTLNDTIRLPNEEIEELVIFDDCLGNGKYLKILNDSILFQGVLVSDNIPEVVLQKAWVGGTVYKYLTLNKYQVSMFDAALDSIRIDIERVKSKSVVKVFNKNDEYYIQVEKSDELDHFSHRLVLRFTTGDDIYVKFSGGRKRKLKIKDNVNFISLHKRWGYSIIRQFKLGVFWDLNTKDQSNYTTLYFPKY